MRDGTDRGRMEEDRREKERKGKSRRQRNDPIGEVWIRLDLQKIQADRVAFGVVQKSSPHTHTPTTPMRSEGLSDPPQDEGQPIRKFARWTVCVGHLVHLAIVVSRAAVLVCQCVVRTVGDW